MQRAGQISNMESSKNVWILTVTSERKKPNGRLRNKREECIKTDLRKYDVAMYNGLSWLEI